MTGLRATTQRRRLLALAAAAVAMLAGVAASAGEAAREDIFVLRSIREAHAPEEGWCTPARTGFEPFAEGAERLFSFWSVDVRPDGAIADAEVARVASLRACFGPTDERSRQKFYAEIALGPIALRGSGECRAVMIDVPEPGLVPVSCQLVLGGLPPPYVGGLLTTNTLTSRAAFGGDTDPAGYTQASIATIRLWKAPERPPEP